MGGFRIPIGLAFFMHSSVTDGVVAMYPSPAGATESELHLERGSGWWRSTRCCAPRARRRGADRRPRLGVAAIAPIDRCYKLVGLIKASWEGISGGAGVERAVAEFLEGLR